MFEFRTRKKEVYLAAFEAVSDCCDTGEYVTESLRRLDGGTVLKYRCCGSDTKATFIKPIKGERCFVLSGPVEQDVAGQLARFGVIFDRKENIRRVY